MAKSRTKSAAATKVAAKKPGARKPSGPKAVPPQGVEADDIPGPPPVRQNTPPFTSAPAGWARGDDVLDHVTTVRTIFPDLNRATRVGGIPTKRITTVHGETHGGKSALVLGLIRSFLDFDDPGALVDAEHTTPKAFAEECFARKLSEIPHFFGDRPNSYEETITKIDNYLKWVGDLRRGKKEGKVWVAPPRPELACICAVDSINKLVPEGELEKILKDSDNINMGTGRMRANLNQSWLDHLVPLLGAANCAMILVAQERASKDLKPWERPHIKGGGGLLFDASLIMRVTKSSPYRDGPESEKDAPIIGFKHNIRIWKSKVGAMDGYHTDAVFHVSNGSLVPAGFDTARDAIHVAIEHYNLFEMSGSWITWRKRRYQSRRQMHLALSRDPMLLAELMVDINGRIDADLVKGEG